MACPPGKLHYRTLQGTLRMTVDYKVIMTGVANARGLVCHVRMWLMQDIQCQRLGGRD